MIYHKYFDDFIMNRLKTEIVLKRIAHSFHFILQALLKLFLPFLLYIAKKSNVLRKSTFQHMWRLFLRVRTWSCLHSSILHFCGVSRRVYTWTFS